MESIDTDMGALALEHDHEHDDGVSAERSAAETRDQAVRDRERELSAAIGTGLHRFFEVLVDFDPAFERVMELGRKLKAGELRLRSVLDVSGDFGDAEEGEGEEPGVRRALAGFDRLQKLRQSYARLSEGPRRVRRRAEVVKALEELSLHPHQLRAIDEELGAKVADLDAARRALATTLKAPAPESLKAWKALAKKRLNGATKTPRAKAVAQGLAELQRLEADVGEPLPAFRRKATELHAAHAQVDEAKTAMVRAYLHLVERMAARYAGRGLDLGDLVQEGAVGLMRGVERFDHRRGLKFATYAHWWIRQAFTRALAEHSRTVRLPVNVNEQLLRLKQVTAELSQKFGRDPTIEEAAKVAGIPVERATHVLQSQRPVLSLDEELDDDGEATWLDRLADPQAVDPTEERERDELGAVLKSVMAELSPKEQEVLKLRFGFGGKDHQTLEEIGSSMGVSRERVRQIEARALKTLRKRSGALDLEAWLH